MFGATSAASAHVREPAHDGADDNERRHKIEDAKHLNDDSLELGGGMNTPPPYKEWGKGPESHDHEDHRPAP